MKEISAIVLAAGRSRRMGQCKPLLPFGHTTVIESCLSNLSDAGVQELIVVAGFHREDVSQQLRESSVMIVANNDPESEMNDSIAIGLSSVSPMAEAVLITPADLPAVPPRVIRALIQSWVNGASLVQPEYNGRGGHPVLIDLRYREELTHLDPESGLRGFFTNHREQVTRLPVDSGYIARDMDTWEDYVELHRDVFGVAPEAK